MTLVYPSDVAMSSRPLAAPFAPGRQSYRATFSDGDKADVVGQTTATWEGLDVGTWEGSAGILKVVGGSLVGVAGGTGFVGLPILGLNGVHATWLVRKMPTAGLVYIDIFRAISGSNVNSYRLTLDSVSGARLMVRTGSTDITALSPFFPVANGQTVGIRWVGGVLSLFIGGTAKIHVPNNQISPVGYTGPALSATGSGFELDNPEVDIY